MPAGAFFVNIRFGRQITERALCSPCSKINFAMKASLRAVGCVRLSLAKAANGGAGRKARFPVATPPCERARLRFESIVEHFYRALCKLFVAESYVFGYAGISLILVKSWRLKTLLPPALASCFLFSSTRAAAKNAGAVLLGIIVPAMISLSAQAQVTVVSRQPVRHAVAAARTAPVTVGFSQPISAASAGNMRVYSPLLWGKRAGSVTGGGSSVLTFAPAQPFAAGEALSVSLPPNPGKHGWHGA